MTRMNWQGAMAKEKARQGAARGLFKAAEYTLENANRIVPHETGDMEASGFTDVDDRQLEATVNYDTPYAVKQHEELGYNHPGKGEAKWLEKTVDQEGSTNQEIIGDEIRKSMR